jgi:hypothetical protein
MAPFDANAGSTVTPTSPRSTFAHSRLDRSSAGVIGKVPPATTHS